MRLFRIRTLILGVALLPLAGLTVFAARDAMGRWGTAQDARVVATDAELVDRLLTATDALEAELTTADALVQLAEVGLDASFAQELLGVDLTGALAPTRDRFDVSISALGAARADGARFEEPDLVDQIIADGDRLADFRAAVDADRVTAEHITDLRVGLVDDLDRATIAQLAGLADRARLLGSSGGVGDAVRVADQTVDVLDLVRQETVDLSALLVPMTRSGGSEPAADLAVTSALLEHEIDRLESLLAGDALVDWQRVGSAPAIVEYEQLRDQALAGDFDATGGLDLGPASTAVRGGVARAELMIEFAGHANQRVIDEAAAAGRGARSDLRLSMLLAGTVAAATFVGTILIARSLVRPLQQLETRARRITQGELVESEQPSSGPREIAVVDQALSELSHGLQVLETQAEALSTGDLSAPVLETTSPGRLGHSLQRSVKRLSEMAARLDHQARHDALTGLLDRAAGIDAIAAGLARAGRVGTDVALLFVDLDGFKIVNDVHGHAVGDEVLRDVAVRLVECCRQVDAVARLGGDEFIVVIDDAREIAAAVEVANRLLGAVSQPFVIDGSTVALSTSVGIAWAPRGASTAPDLLVQADLALYRAKARGKNRVEIFDEHLQHAVEHRAEVESGLRGALERGELELWYQPTFRLAPLEVSGAEALVRWRTSDDEIVMPGEFIAVAERSDLILDLDRYVLGRACEQLVAWREDELTRGLQMSVNVSGRHLDVGDLVSDLGDILSATGAPAEQLTVELTETRLIEDLQRVSGAVAQLRALSIGVAIDDFGTGYSSVAHLRRLPVTQVKVDRSLVSGSHNQTDRSILELLIWLGATLGLEVVAEGIEDEDQLRLVTELGSTHGQGFLLGRPMPAADVEPWLLRHRSETVVGTWVR